MKNSTELELTDHSVNDVHENAVTQFIEANGTMFAYRTFGSMESEPLLFLQHFTGTMDDWDPAITNGFARHFKVILFDNKGIGASGGETPDTIQAMAQDAFSFMKALGLSKVNIMGFSMGGFIAQQMTLDAPNFIHKAILVGTGSKSSQGLADIINPLTHAASLSPREGKLFLFYSQSPISRALGEASLSRINKRTIDRAPDTSGPSIQAQLKSILEWAQPDIAVVERLNEMKQPTLVVNGNNDIMVPTINSYMLFQHLPNAKLSLYPDSGHGSLFQYPKLFLNEAIPFLQAP